MLQLLWVLVLSTCALWAQNAAVSGSIVDSSGASIPKAKVTVRNLATNVAVATTTNSQGLFFLPPVAPGTYQLTATATGFSEAEVNNLLLEVGQQRTVTLKLEPGQIKQTISVEAAAPLLNVQSADRGSVVENQFLKSIPLNVRNPMLLLTLAPGVTGGLNAGINTASQSTTNNFRINGGRGATNEILIDGASNTGTYNNQVSAMPQVDSIQEFKVNTSPYAPEFGRTGGGVISFAMRSGTNNLHGTLHNFLRNSVLDSNGFNANRAGLPRRTFRRNQFGGTFGGPVQIPKLYNGKNKTFFFFAYEGLRERSIGSFTGSVPTDLERLGNFSGTRLQNGNLIQLFDPRTTRLDPDRPAGVTRYIRDPFVGNIIPSNLLGNIAINAVKFYPQPNQRGDGGSNINNFFSSAPNSLDGDRIDTKVDHQFSNSHSVFARWNWFENLNAQPSVFNNFASPVQTPNRIPGTNWAGNHIWSVKPTFLIEHFFSLNQSETNRTPLSLGFDATTLGVPASVATAPRQAYFPVLNIGRITGLGPQGTASNSVVSRTLQYQLKGTQQLGKHSAKFGYDWRRFRVSIDNPQPLGISASGSFTGGPNPQAQAAASGHGLADLFLGVANVNHNIRPREQHQHYYNAWFFQDEWRVTSKLTLTAGLRYSIETPRTESRNQYVFLDLNSASPLQAQVPSLPLRGGLGFVGTQQIPGRRTQLVQRNMFDPRLGIAFQLNSKTVLRSGIGIFHHPLVPNTDVALGFSRNTSSLVAQADGVTPQFNLNNPWPTGLLQPTGNTLGLNTLLGQGLSGPLRVQALPYQLQWSFDVQRQLPGNWVAEVGYAANNAYRLPSSVQYNQLAPETVAQFGSAVNQTVPNPFFGVITDPTSALSLATVQRGQLLRPYPQFTGMGGSQVATGQSSYHAIQTRVERRYSRGLAVLFAYTFSKTIDNTAELGGFLGASPGYQNSYCYRCDRSLSYQHVPHAIRLSTRYDLPKLTSHKLLGQAINGWGFGSFLSIESGTPVLVSSPNDSQSFGGGSGMRPNATGVKASLGKVDLVDGVQYFNAGAFTRTPQFQFGNVSRSLPDVRNPRQWNWDALIEKRFRVTERVSLDFRSEFFNLTNSVVFGGPSNSITAGDFGKITTLRQNNTPRQLQFALRLSF